MPNNSRQYKDRPMNSKSGGRERYPGPARARGAVRFRDKNSGHPDIIREPRQSAK